ncbi:hypothetical protein BBD41_10075 [Paenibacillus ihbetae]|uniref:Uncharacterized protein n=1 Tax=Paenibacillus ihbetae TaxID=1870820 RepID=A0A1B2DYT8_9BACL|nr:hypothetical protein [Paenibacillus ihbetae]ANY72908.1 hypothetical protein BBD41_10075 [Paenibacillus ihbetae]
MSAYYNDPYNENETVSSGYAVEIDPDYASGGQEGAETARDAVHPDQTGMSDPSLWNDGADGENWMNGWDGREETHAMFRQSYE